MVLRFEHLGVLLQLFLKIMDTKLYIIRHGETVENASGTLQGIIPGHLNEKGWEQARALRDKLANVELDAAICSDLQRCRDTADIVLAGRQLEVNYTPLLRERDWGSFTGKSIATVKTNEFPPDVETVKSMFSRAETFFRYVEENYAGKRVLVVSHGLFSRVMQAYFYGKGISDIPRMTNGEMRVLTINDAAIGHSASVRQNHDEVTAD